MSVTTTTDTAPAPPDPAEVEGMATLLDRIPTRETRAAAAMLRALQAALDAAERRARGLESELRRLRIGAATRGEG